MFYYVVYSLHILYNRMLALLGARSILIVRGLIKGDIMNSKSYEDYKVLVEELATALMASGNREDILEAMQLAWNAGYTQGELEATREQLRNN